VVTGTRSCLIASLFTECTATSQVPHRNAPSAWQYTSAGAFSQLSQHALIGLALLSFENGMSPRALNPSWVRGPGN